MVLTWAGQMIQGIRFLQSLSVFIPRCTWLPSLRDQGMRRDRVGSFQFLWVIMVCRDMQAAKGRLAVTLLCGGT